MDERRFAQIREIFHAACDLEPSERQPYLDRACSSDTGLRDEIDALFELEETSSNNRLMSPAIRSSFLQQFDPAAAASVAAAPNRIGKFRIIAPLGEGSMGVVYLAEQDHPNRIVALKVMRGWDPSPIRLRRFHREIDLLGRLQHPGIARVYEAGTGEIQTAAGVLGKQPYFALERIEGDRLLEYCEKHKLGLRKRLALVADIADAVHHAHCRGVVHRDLKPSNILVDASHQPKILDFGLSRATDAGSDASHRTEAGQILGTIAYASPEQLRGDSENVDVRSDLYSLGVILFELLTGRLPIDIRGLDLPQAIRRIAETEPAIGSKLNQILRGDLDAILAKALEKDRERRYSSAAELAADIRRHLNEEPIAARPLTTALLLRKALRRHRFAVAAGGLALFGTLAGLSYGLLEARSQRDAAMAAESRAVEAGKAEVAARRTAERDAKIAAAVAGFLNDDLLAATGAAKNPSRSMPLGEVLDAAAARLEGKFPDEPLVEAAIRGTLGLSYLKLGDYAAAEPQVRRAHALREAHLPPGDPARFETQSLMAYLLGRFGQFADAVANYEQLVAQCRENPGLGEVATATVVGGLGWTRMQMGQFERAEPLLREAVDLLRQADGDALEQVRTQTNLGMCLLRQKRYPEAESVLNAAVELARAHGVEDNADALNAAGALAAMLNEQSKFDEAVPLLEAHLEKQRRILGPEHPQTLITQANLAHSHLHAGRLAEAETLIDATLEARRRILGEPHPHTVISLMQSAVLRMKQRRLPEAEQLLLRGIDLTHDNPAISKKMQTDWLSKLVDTLEMQGRNDEALKYRAQIAAP